MQAHTSPAPPAIHILPPSVRLIAHQKKKISRANSTGYSSPARRARQVRAAFSLSLFLSYPSRCLAPTAAAPATTGAPCELCRLLPTAAAARALYVYTTGPYVNSRPLGGYIAAAALGLCSRGAVRDSL